MADSISPSVQSQLVINDGSTNHAFEFVSESLRYGARYAVSRGIRGTRQQYGERARLIEERVSGSITFEPTPTELDVLIPWFLGGTTAAGVTAPGESLAAHTLYFARVRKMHTYTGCKPSRATLSINQGQPIQLSLDIEGTTRAIGAVSLPSATYPTDNIFIPAHCTLTVEGAARKFRNFVLTIDNRLDAERFYNSTTRTLMDALDLDVSLSASVPYSADNEDLETAVVAGAAASLAITDGTTTYTVAFANLKVAPQDPVAGPAGSEIELPLSSMKAYRTVAADQIKFTKS